MSPTGTTGSNMRLELEAIATDPDEDNFLEGPFEELYKLIPKVEQLVCQFSE